MKSCNNDSASFILYAVLVSITLAKNLKPAEQDLLGIFLQEVGGNLSSMSAYDEYFQDINQINYKPNVGPIIK